MGSPAAGGEGAGGVEAVGGRGGAGEGAILARIWKTGVEVAGLEKVTCDVI
jgi:hypothetical protein